MKAVSTCFFLLVFMISEAQPDLTLWRVFENHDHTSGDNHQQEPELYECGSYYFFVSDGVEESIWSIKNEGSSNLEIQLPLRFDPNAATSMEISQQPDKSVLAPGEETLFKIKYDFYGVHGDFFLDIESNDVANSTCGLLVGGNVLDCTCYCVEGMTESIGICDKGDFGTTGGIPLMATPCSSVGESCQPISISDPCSCDNTITSGGGQLLYRDTLSIMTIANTVLMLTENRGGFLDMNGTLVADGTPLTQANADGIVKHIFYRLPSEGVDITVNGVVFNSSSVCPDAAACNPDSASIPTMGEWGLISLALMFLILSIVGIKVQHRKISLH